LRDCERVSETRRISKDSKYNVRRTAVLNTQCADEALGLPVNYCPDAGVSGHERDIANFMVTRHIEKC